MFFMLMVYSLVYLSSPVYLSLLIIILAIFTSVFMWLVSSKWAALAFSLIFIGGMMVVFLYISSLSANLKTKNWKWKELIMINFLVLPLIAVKEMDNAYMNPATLYSWNSYFLISYLLIYLLLTLWVVSKLSNAFKGPLTEKFF